MASNAPSSLVVSKAANCSKATVSSGQSSPAHSQTGSIAGGENYPQRRSGSIGLSTSRANPSPRNNQQQRKQHKSSKKLPKLGDEDALTDLSAMRSSNRKGMTNITHLMNFTLAPRPYYHHQAYGSHNRRAPTWGLGSGYHAVDKARYVHANYRFIVDPRADCHVQSIDADVHLEWNDVLQILASSQSQAASCPICLGDPVAPRMAKCGHIFCLPCLIRFMHSEDDVKHAAQKKARSKKCPICEDTIFTSETKPVRLYAGQEIEAPREGGDIVLRLVKRSAGSTLALPRDGAAALSHDEDVPWYFAAEAMDYARIMKGTEEYMNAQFEGDIQTLEAQEQFDSLMFPEDTAEWTRKAVRMINEAKEKIKGIGGPVSVAMQPDRPKMERPPIQFSDSNDLPAMHAVQHERNSGRSVPEIRMPPNPAGTGSGSKPSVASTADASASTKSPTPAARHSLQAHRVSQSHGHGAPSEYFFYQALLHYYLSPLDIRILRESFGNFASFPATILPRVERVSTGHIVDDELRKRTKYLSHLPYGCEVNFLECDWTDTVSPEILEKFKPEIERRRKRNEDKEALEEKARVNAEKEEEKRYAHLRRKRPEAASSEWLAVDDSQSFVGATGADVADADSASTSPPWTTQRQGSSFASLASISTSPSTSRTVWGTPAIAAGGSPTMTAVQPEQESVDDGWLQGWEKDLLQEDDLVAQAQAISLGESSNACAVMNTSTVGGKKKKAKKITLMSTTVRRGA